MLVHFAGLTIEVTAKYASVYRFLERYEAPEGAVPDFSVSVTEDEIDRERIPGEDFPKGYLESLALYRKISREALRYQTFLFHGSAIAIDGEGYIFTAPSGTGKSTHTSLWREVYGDRVVMVNDDKPLLSLHPTGLYVSGTPWGGKHHLSTPITVPVRGICFLSRGEKNTIVPVSAGEAYSRMLVQTYRPDDEIGLRSTLLLLDRAVRETKFYRMQCNMDPEAAVVAYEGMKGQK